MKKPWSRSENGGKKNAFTPGVWLATPLIAILVPMSVYGPQWAAISLFMLVAIVVIVLLAVFVRHSLKDPDQLRSEEFGLAKSALNMYGNQSVSADDLVAIISSKPVTLLEYKEGQHGD